MLRPRTCMANVISPRTSSMINIHSNQPIRFEGQVYSLCFYITVIHLQFPSDFRDELCVGLGLAIGIWLGLHIWTIMLIHDQQNMFIQEHASLGKTTVYKMYKSGGVLFIFCSVFFSFVHSVVLSLRLC